MAIRSADNRQVFFTNETEDILRKSLTAAVQYTYRRTFYNFHFLTLGYSSNTVDEDVLTENPNYFLHGDNSLRYLYMSYTFRHDNRDLAAYATKGELLQATATKYGIFNTDDIDEIEVRHYSE